MNGVFLLHLKRLSMTEITALESKVESLSQNVNSQLSGVRTDIKELTSALRDLIRMDGEIKNISLLVNRIGGEVDDHEERMRKLEQHSIVNSVKIGAGERVYWMLALVALNVFTGVVVYTVNH